MILGLLAAGSPADGPWPSTQSTLRADGPGWASAELACQEGPLTLAIEMVCCSMASWIATRSSSRICVGETNVHQSQARGWAGQRQRESYRSNHSPVLTPCQANGKNWVPSNPGVNCVGSALFSPLWNLRLGEVKLLPTGVTP